LDVGNVPGSSIAMLGCGSRGDVSGGTGDGALNANIPAPYNIPEGAPCSESFNDGPSHVEGDKVVTAGKGALAPTRANLEATSFLTAGELGDSTYRQDTRDMYAYHSKSLNVVFADGSVRSFSDSNGDGFINPGFGINPASATIGLTGYTSPEVEVSSFEWYTGIFLESKVLEKRFEN
jgi:prepilin-type processing-associated H-X9-DG protein